MYVAKSLGLSTKVFKLFLADPQFQTAIQLYAKEQQKQEILRQLNKIKFVHLSTSVVYYTSRQAIQHH